RRVRRDRRRVLPARQGRVPVGTARSPDDRRGAVRAAPGAALPAGHDPRRRRGRRAPPRDPARPPPPRAARALRHVTEQKLKPTDTSTRPDASPALTAVSGRGGGALRGTVIASSWVESTLPPSAKAL